MTASGIDSSDEGDVVKLATLIKPDCVSRFLTLVPESCCPCPLAMSTAVSGSGGTGGGGAATSAHLKKFTHSQIAKKAAQRAADVPQYKQLLLACQVKADKDGIIVDTQSETWKKLLRLCQEADDLKKKKESGTVTVNGTDTTPPSTTGSTDSTPTNSVPTTPAPTPTTNAPFIRQSSTPLPTPAPQPTAAVNATTATIPTTTAVRSQSGLPTTTPIPTTTAATTSQPTAASTNTIAAPPTPTPTPPPVSTSATNSLERLLSKAAQAVRNVGKDLQKDLSTPSNAAAPTNVAPVPAPAIAPSTTVAIDANNTSNPVAIRRSETPDPGTSPPNAIPNGTISRASVSLSSSPQQFQPGAFLPPPPATSAVTMANGAPSSAPSQPPRVTRTGSTSNANAFISSLPPPQLPAGGTNSNLSSSTTTSTPSSSSSAKSFFKDFLNKVSNEMNSITSSSSSSSATSAASTSTSSTNSNTSQDSSSTNNNGIPPAEEKTFLPVSGPFPQPVLSPMLAQTTAAATRTPPIMNRLVRSNSNKQKGQDSLPAINGTFEAPVLPPEFLAAPPTTAPGSGHLVKKKSKRASEVAQIVRASAKLLPTPFQPDRPLSSNSNEKTTSDGTDANGDATVEVGAVLNEDEVEGKTIEEEFHQPHMRKMKKVKEGKKKAKKSAKVEVSPISVESDASKSLSPSESPVAAPESIPSVIIQPIPIPSKQPILDGIDLSDLVDDEPAVGHDGENGQVEPAAEGEGEGEGEEAVIEGGEDSQLPYALLALPIAIQTTLTELEMEVIPKWRENASLSDFVPLLQESLACFTVIDTVRREQFGSLGCESIHGTHVPITDYTSVVHGHVVQFIGGQAVRVKLLNDASFQSSLTSFIHQWIQQAVEPVILNQGESFSSVLLSPHPSTTATPALITTCSQRVQALATGLTTSDSAHLLPQFQQLFLVFLQLRFQERFTMAADSVWTVDDILLFIQMYTPLLNKKQVVQLCNHYMLNEVTEKLYPLFELSTSSTTPSSASSKSASSTSNSIGMIEQRITSSNSDHILHGFQLLNRQRDVLLSYRHLHSCFNKFATTTLPATNFTQNLAVYHALEHSAQFYPQIAPWVIVKYLDIHVSLYHQHSTELLTNRSATIERRCIDLSRAPDSLSFHASFLESSPSSTHSGSPVALDRLQQQYHFYYHYLKSLLGIYEIVRRNEEMILEYIRLLMCFGRKSKTQLFRRHTEQQDGAANAAAAILSQHADQGAYVPVRDSHLASWVHESAIISILSQPTIYAFNRGTLGRLFAKYGFFKGVVMLYIQELSDSTIHMESEERLAIIDQCFLIALCCDDLPTFLQCVDTFILSAATPLEQRVHIWKYILNQLHAMLVSPDAASIAPHHLTLRVLLNHLLYSIGSQLAVTLLLSEPIYIELCDRAHLPASFYTDIFEHAILRSEQQALSQSMLEQLDAYLWSDRSPNVNEQFRAIYNTEVSVAIKQKQEATPTQPIVGRGGSNSTGSSSVNTRSNSPHVPAVQKSLTSSHPLAPFIQYIGDNLSSADEEKSSLPTPTSRGRRSSSAAAMNPIQRLMDYQLTFDYTGGGNSSSNPQSSSFPFLPAAHGLPRYYEDMSNHGHWGVSLHLDEGRCAECTLPFTMTPSTNPGNSTPSSSSSNSLNGGSTGINGGICIFRCHHLYHATCLPERACTRCWEEECIRQTN